MAQEELKTYILGGGVAGLIWAYYNDGYVVTPEIGGQMSSQFPLGPRFLHKNEYSIELLKDLNIEIKERTIKTGYQTRGNCAVDVMLDQNYRRRYYMKSRGLKTLDGYDETSMSSGKNCFQALDVDFTELITKIVAKIYNRIIIAKVVQIDTRDKTLKLDNGDYLFYKDLVNTMPLNVFSKLLVRDENIVFPKSDYFKCEPITFVWLKPIKFDFDYIYVAAASIPHHRLTFDNKGRIAEWFGVHDIAQCKKRYKDDFIDSKTLWTQIIPTTFEHNLKDILFIGRYGTWDRHWKTEKVIEEAIKHSEFKILGVKHE